MKRFYLAALMCAALSFAGCNKNSEPEPPVEYDVTLEASAFYGNYFGQEFGNNMEYGYFVFLSDGDTFRPENKHYYQFEIFSNEGAASSRMRVPPTLRTSSCQQEPIRSEFRARPLPVRSPLARFIWTTRRMEERSGSKAERLSYRTTETTLSLMPPLSIMRVIRTM